MFKECILRIKLRLFCLTASLITISALAQTGGNRDFSPKTPEAAAFEQVGEIPVGNYTGTPNISIPLYTTENGDLQLPITLENLGTSVRVDQEATWVGLNWMLNAGGAVTTQLSPYYGGNGWYAGSDKQEWEYLMNRASMTTVYPNGGGYDYKLGYKIDGQHPDWCGGFGYNWFPRPMQIPDTVSYNHDLPPNVYTIILTRGDGEAPRYHATFPGHSVDFVWDRLKGEYFITGDAQGLRISGGLGGAPTITDEGGVMYEFRAIESGSPEGYGIDPSFNRYDYTFYLTKITSPTGRTITLKYKNTGVTHPVYKVNEQLFDRMYPYSAVNGFAQSQHSGPVDWQVVGNSSNLIRTLSQYYTLHPMRLTSIETDNQVVRFVHSTQKRQDIRGDDYSLSSIEVYNKEQDETEKLVKRFRFDYSYSDKNTTGGNTVKDLLGDLYTQWFSDDGFMYKRLILNKVWEESEEDGIIQTKPPYLFNYNSTNLPCKASAAVDFWGYYNGKENYNGTYHSLIPRGYGESTYDGVNSFPDSYLKQKGADRRINTLCMSYGMLKSITYPTGASITFEYEPHTFDNLNYYRHAISKDDEDIRASVWQVYASNNPQYSQSGNTISGNEIRFAVETTGEYQVSVTYTKMNTARQTHWKDLMGRHTALLVKHGDDSERIENMYSFSLTPADTVGNVNSICFRRTMLLQRGRYVMTTTLNAPLDSCGMYTIVGRINTTSSSQSLCNYGSYGYHTLPNVTFPTYKTYVCNVSGYSQSGNNVAKNEIQFNIDSYGEYKLDLCFMKNNMQKKAFWRNLVGRCPVLLYKYSGDTENVSSCTPYFLTVADTVDVTGNSIAKYVTTKLKQGKYKLAIVSSGMPVYPNGFYQIDASVRYQGKAENEIKMESSGGGMRVKSVTTNIDGITSKTSYEYKTEDGKSSGLLMAPVIYARKKMIVYQPNQVQYDNHSGWIAPPAPSRYSYWTANGSNIAPPPSVYNTYSRVTATKTSDGESNGKTVYEYHNNRWASGSWCDYMRRIEDPLNGKLEMQTDYDANDSVVRRVTNDYQMRCSDSRLLSAVMENIYVGPSGTTGGAGPVSNNLYAAALQGGCMQTYLYPSVQFSMLSSTSETKEFINGKTLTQFISTQYNQKNHLDSVVTERVSRAGESITKETIYPSDYHDNSLATHLINKNIINVPMETVTSVTNSMESVVAAAERIDYNDKGLPADIYSIKSGNVSRNSFVRSDEQENNSFYEKVATITYNSGGKPRTVTEYDNSVTTYIWGYGNHYPIAVIKGAGTAEVTAALGGTDAVDTLEDALAPTISAEALFSNLSSIPNTLVTVYEFSPLVGMVRMTAPNGENTEYDYDSFARLVTVTDHDGIVAKAFQYHYKNE